MPRTIQQSMVRKRPIMVMFPARLTIRLMRMDARPVTVIQPAMIPAMPQATATVIAPLLPALRASMERKSVLLRQSTKMLPALSPLLSSLWVRKRFTKPMRIAAKIEIAADQAIVLAPVATSVMRRISGRIR